MGGRGGSHKDFQGYIRALHSQQTQCKLNKEKVYRRGDVAHKLQTRKKGRAINYMSIYYNYNKYWVTTCALDMSAQCTAWSRAISFVAFPFFLRMMVGRQQVFQAFHLNKEWQSWIVLDWPERNKADLARFCLVQYGKSWGTPKMPYYKGPHYRQWDKATSYEC